MTCLIALFSDTNKCAVVKIAHASQGKAETSKKDKITLVSTCTSNRKKQLKAPEIYTKLDIFRSESVPGTTFQKQI